MKTIGRQCNDMEIGLGGGQVNMFPTVYCTKFGIKMFYEYEPLTKFQSRFGRTCKTG